MFHRVMSKLLVFSAVMVASTAIATDKDIATSKVIAPFSAIYTESATRNYETSEVYLCGGVQVSASVCASYFGDTYLRLVDASGFELVSNDDACDEGSAFTTTIPNSYGCGTFYIRQGCYGSGSCGGTVSYTTSTSESVPNSPEDKKLSTYSELVKLVNSAAPSASPSAFPTAIGSKIVKTKFGFTVSGVDDTGLNELALSVIETTVANLVNEPADNVNVVQRSMRRLSANVMAAIDVDVDATVTKYVPANTDAGALQDTQQAALKAAITDSTSFTTALLATATSVMADRLYGASVSGTVDDLGTVVDIAATLAPVKGKKGKKGDKKENKGKKGKGEAKQGKDSGKSGKKDKDSGKKAKDSGKKNKDSGKKGKGKKL